MRRQFLGEGLSHHQAGRLDQARQLYLKELSVDPNSVEALHLLGVLLCQQDDPLQAFGLIRKALAARPNYPEAHNNLGNALAAIAGADDSLQKLKRFEEALASYDRALTLRPEYVEALYNRGRALYELERFEEALASYDRALALRPTYAEAVNNRGVALKELKRLEEALAGYDRALMLRPNYPEALFNRGNILKELKRFDEALTSYDRAIALRPNYAEALSNRGLTLYELKRFEEALASYDRALMLRPNCAETHFNEAFCRLLIGDFIRGWEKFEWRGASPQARGQKRNFAQPLWDGSKEIAGKTILLHAEQGFGDTIQFCRYVPLVVERGARVLLEVQTPLHGLMRTLSGGAEIISRGDPLPDFDMHCPLPSLPLAFATRLKTIPAKVPYLAPSEAYIEKWRLHLTKSSGVRIGVCWAGNPRFRRDSDRSIGLLPLLPLLSHNWVSVFSLQKDLREGDWEILQRNPQIRHLGAEIESFEDTAAIISLLDLVISSDTSIVHLAGALGKPVWILLQFVPDWRWLVDREDSPWYPTARLFRQKDSRAWDHTIARVHSLLNDFVGAA